MKKVYSLLLAVPVVLGISMISACRHREAPRTVPPTAATLDVIFNGPFVIVLQNSEPSKVIVFTPRDKEGFHGFYVNDLEQSQDKQKNYHFKLSPDGLKAAASPSIDTGLADFNFQTDSWKREKDYFVTIELPVPDKITFAPPQHQVTFENGATGFMSTNFIFQYLITEPGKIQAVSDELGSKRPLASAALQDKYLALCGVIGQSQKFHNSCIEMRNLLAQSAGAPISVFLFGVGRLPTDQNKLSEDVEGLHAVQFFNEALLRSFPGLSGKRLALPASADNGGSKGMLVQASFKLPVSGMRALPVSAVIDCKAGGFIVTTTK
jgi:hypothetical protein